MPSDDEKQQYSIIRIPKLDSTNEDLPFKVPKDVKKTMQYSVDRLPVELPGVMGAADLDLAYGFSKYGQTDVDAGGSLSTLKWDVDVFTAVGGGSHEAGDSLDTVCDADAISSGDPTVFTYIFTANAYENELSQQNSDIPLNKAWLLGATVAGPTDTGSSSNNASATPISDPPTSDKKPAYSPLAGLGFGVQNTVSPDDGTWGSFADTLSIKPGTCGIQKGPAMPLSAPSPYLTSPAFLPAITIPGVTAPSTTPEEREKPFDEDKFSIGIRFTDSSGAHIIERQACYNQYADDRINLNVAITYNPSSKKFLTKIPDGSSFKVVLSFKGSADSIKILDCSGKDELLNSSKTEREIEINWDQKSTTISADYCLRWALTDAEAEFKDTELVASVKPIIKHNYKGAPTLFDTEPEPATLDFKCSSAPLEDLYDIEVVVKDNAGKEVSERSCCDSNDSVADSNLLTAHVRVTKTDKGKDAFIDTEKVMGTLYITPEEGKGVDIVLGQGPASRPVGATYPLTATINLPDSAYNEAVTDIEFQYFSPAGWSCNSGSGKKDPVTISVVGCIHQGSAPENPDDCSGPKSDVVDIELQCNCDDCSSKLSSLKTSMSFLDDNGTGTYEKAENPRKVCDGGTGEAPAATPWFVCKVTVDGLDNLGDACTETMRNLVMRIEAHSDNGTLLAFGQDFEKYAEIRQITHSWERTNTFKIFYAAPVTSGDNDWKDEIHVRAWLTYSGEVDADASVDEIGSSEDEMILSCKDPSEDEDCAEHLRCELLLFEYENLMCKTTLETNRAHGTKDGAEDSNPYFCVSPKIYLNEDANLSSCSVLWTLTLKPDNCRIAELIYGYVPSTKILAYTGSFNATTAHSGPESELPKFVYQPDSGKNGSIEVTFDVYKEYTDSDTDEVATRVVEATKKITLDYEGEDDDDDDDEENAAACDVLKGLTVSKPLSITDCADGKRHISLDSSVITCEALNEMANNGGDSITVSCGGDDGGSISVGELACSHISGLLKPSTGIDIDGCTISVKIDDDTIKINNKGQLVAKPPAQTLPKIVGIGYIDVQPDGNGGYVISLKHTKKCDE